MYKLTKTFLHLWMLLASIVGLAFGWAFLAHSQKPAPLLQPQVQIFTSSQPTLEPILTINDFLKNGTRSVPVFQNSNITFPRLRTRGS
jgi:hypothetical protein